MYNILSIRPYRLKKYFLSATNIKDTHNFWTNLSPIKKNIPLINKALGYLERTNIVRFSKWPQLTEISFMEIVMSFVNDYSECIVPHWYYISIFAMNTAKIYERNGYHSIIFFEHGGTCLWMCQLLLIMLHLIEFVLDRVIIIGSLINRLSDYMWMLILSIGEFGLYLGCLPQ